MFRNIFNEVMEKYKFLQNLEFFHHWICIILFLLIFLSVNLNCNAVQNSDNIKVFHLNNGQTVVIKEIHSNPIVTVDTWVKTGSVNEDDSNNGVSHFLEHLLFKGTKKYKVGEVDRILESRGGHFNAATSKDFTHFYITLPSQYFDTAVDLHSDMLLNAQIPEAELNRERKVVQEEIRRADDSPERIQSDNIIKTLFKSHPYKYDTLGTSEIIGSIPRSEILKYYHRWYIPSNMITVIVGDVDTHKALSLVKQKFGDNLTAKAPQIKYSREPQVIKTVEIVKKGNYNVAYLDIAFKGVPVTDQKDNNALDIAANVLGNGRTSRLYQNVKDKLNIVTSVDAGNQSMKDDSIFIVDANLDPQNYTIAKESIIKEIEKLKQGITQEELKRAKIQLQRQFLYSSESTENIANSIGYTMTIGGNIDYYTKYIDELNKITAYDVKLAVNKYLLTSKMAVAGLLPENSNVGAIPKSEETYNNITKSVLSNGATLITDKNISNEIISMSLIFKGGDLIETKPGITDLITGILLKGTKNRSALELSKELENSGIIIAPSSNPDYFEIQLKSTAQDFDKALEILADVVNNPLFNQEDIDKFKIDILQSIQKSRDNPLPLAMEKFNREVFPNHPYGFVGEVLEKNIPNITRDEIINFYKDYFIPENLVIAASGKIDQKLLSDKINAYFPLKCGKIVDIAGLQNQFKPFAQNKSVMTAKQTSAAWVIMGWPVRGIAAEKDYASLKIIDALLGSGLSSRLFVDLREKQGLAYQVGSAYPSRLDNNVFMLYIGTEPKNLKTVTDGFLSEINRIKSENISAKELSEEKQKINGQFLLSQETNQGKAHYLAWFESIGKGYKFNYNFPDLINSVTIDDVKQTANKYFNYPYAMSIVAPQSSIAAP
ncbi:MAG: pitrilysin family protein [Candidatus Gastranaerophilales bacterium]|nr:pitrilysin family protein [Candidatus Gastranaerophilales bacterium]